MASFNKVILMGNLTRVPEIRFTQSQMAICKIGMAVNRRFKDGQSGEWKEEATFIDVTIFGKRGEAFEKYHKKGEMAFVEGSLRLDTWEDKNSGQKRSKLKVVGENMQFLGSSGGGGGARPAGGQQEGQPQGQQQAAQPQEGGGSPAASDDSDDEIPF